LVTHGLEKYKSLWPSPLKVRFTVSGYEDPKNKTSKTEVWNNFFTDKSNADIAEIFGDFARKIYLLRFLEGMWDVNNQNYCE